MNKPTTTIVFRLTSPNRDDFVNFTPFDGQDAVEVHPSRANVGIAYTVTLSRDVARRRYADLLAQGWTPSAETQAEEFARNARAAEHMDLMERERLALRWN